MTPIIVSTNAATTAAIAANQSSGSITLTALIIGFIITALIIQYAICFFELLTDSYYDKKEFLSMK